MAKKPTAPAAPARTQLTLLQDQAGFVRQVRVGKETFDVMNAGPVLLQGETGIAMTLKNVDFHVEPYVAPAAS